MSTLILGITYGLSLGLPDATDDGMNTSRKKERAYGGVGDNSLVYIRVGVGVVVMMD